MCNANHLLPTFSVVCEIQWLLNLSSQPLLYSESANNSTFSENAPEDQCSQYPPQVRRLWVMDNHRSWKIRGLVGHVAEQNTMEFKVIQHGERIHTGCAKARSIVCAVKLKLRTKIKFVIQLSVLQRVLIFLDLLPSASQTSDSRVNVSGLTGKKLGS